MKFLIFILLIGNVFSSEDSMLQDSVIFPPVELKNAPYYANIVNWDPFRKAYIPICAASMVSDYWFISAFHCMSNISINMRKIRTGFYQFAWLKNMHDENLIHDIDSVIGHPQFQESSSIYYNDICLIKLEHPLKFKKNKKKPVPLPSSDYNLEIGSEMSILGFGLQKIMLGNSPIINQVNLISGKVIMINSNICAKLYRNRMTNGLFCAVMDTYKYRIEIGDFGAPAIQNSQLVGIFSSGSTERKKEPAIFSKVHMYVDWIENVTGINNNKPGCKGAFLQCYKP